MRCPSWRSCSKSAAASATRSASSSLWRFFMNTGIRSSRSFATMTLQSSSVMPAIIVARPLPLVRDCQMGMDRARRAQGKARLRFGLHRKEDLGEVQDRAEVPRLELERAPDIVQALGVAAEHVVERGALVPGLGEFRRAAQEPRQARLGDVVAPRGDVARGAVELVRRAVM